MQLSHFDQEKDMNLMNLGKIGIAMTIAAGGLIAVATPAVAGTVLGGASVTNGARGTMDGKVVDGPVKVVIPKARGDSQFDVMAANINLPANGGGIDWHTHPGPTFGIVTGGGTLTVIDDDCVEHDYETGDASVAPVNPHTEEHTSELPVTVRAAVFLPRTPPPAPPIPTHF